MNLTIQEGAVLVVLLWIIWKYRKVSPYAMVAYSIFIIIYITLLRRTPVYDSQIRLKIGNWRKSEFWSGTVLNICLYIPLGYSGYRCQKMAGRKNHKRQHIIFREILAGVSLAVCCETLQYVTGRGMADINDVLFNAIGACVGVALAYYFMDNRE